MLQRPVVANAFKSKNGFKILYTQISWGTLSTQREDDNRVRRGEDAAKGATVIFWRLAGGEEEELLALRVLLFDLVAIFFEEGKNHCVEDILSLAPELHLEGKWTTNGRRIDADFNGNSTRHHSNTLHCHTQGH